MKSKILKQKELYKIYVNKQLTLLPRKPQIKKIKKPAFKKEIQDKIKTQDEAIKSMQQKLDKTFQLYECLIEQQKKFLEELNVQSKTMFNIIFQNEDKAIEQYTKQNQQFYNIEADILTMKKDFNLNISNIQINVLDNNIKVIKMLEEMKSQIEFDIKNKVTLGEKILTKLYNKIDSIKNVNKNVNKNV